jgi:hypothetical protein
MKIENGFEDDRELETGGLEGKRRSCIMKTESQGFSIKDQLEYEREIEHRES